MEKAIMQMIKSSGVKFVRIVWADNGNIIRGKTVYTGSLNESHINYGIGISAGQQAVPVMYDAVMEKSGLGPVGEVRLVPDWSSFKILPHEPSHGRVMGDMMQKGEKWPYCSRLFLKKIIDELKKEGLSIKTAFENEFYLLKDDTEEIIPIDNTPFASTQSMDINRAIVEDIVDSLVSQDIQVEMYYPESGPGQQEITFKYTDPLTVCDNQVAYRETVHAVSFKHGVRASFLPKIFPDKAGSGCHLHLSLWKNGKNIIADKKGTDGLSAVTRSFIAGILRHLPALMAVTTPSPNSYRRIKPHFWSGAFRCWGMDNREAPVRVLTSPDGRYISHFEFKTVDGSSNPYLALGAVIAAGLDGIKSGLDIDEPVNVDPGNLPDEERDRRGINLLPQNLFEAIEKFEEDRVLQKALGTELFTAFLAVRKAEFEHMKSFGLEDEVRLLLDKY